VPSHSSPEQSHIWQAQVRRLWSTVVVVLVLVLVLGIATHSFRSPGTMSRAIDYHPIETPVVAL
jgi:hypothetical protein